MNTLLTFDIAAKINKEISKIRPILNLSEQFYSDLDNLHDHFSFKNEKLNGAQFVHVSDCELLLLFQKTLII